MKLEDFKAGRLINQGDFNSFVPSCIDKNWSWENSEINYLLANANKELGGLNTYSELIPNIDVYIKMHIFSEANKSSMIEGTKTSIEEDIMNLEEVSPEKRNDSIEVRNYVNALNHGVKRITNDDFPLTSRLMREMHEILMQGARGERKTPGEFRQSQNWIGGSMPSTAIYVPPSINEMNDLITDMEKFINDREGIPEIIKIGIIHYQFESIHPFLDGNGRIGRLLIPLYLISKNQLDKPCFYISDYFEKNRTEYYNKLNNVRVNNDMIGWIKFFLEATIYTAKNAKKKFKKAIEVVEYYNNYLINSQKRSRENMKIIINTMYQTPVINSTDLILKTNMSKSVLFRLLSDLVNDGIIEEVTGFSRNRVYILTKYLKVFN